MRISRESITAAVDTWDGDAVVTKAHANHLIDHLHVALNEERDEWLRQVKEQVWNDCTAAHMKAQISAWYDGGEPVVPPNPYRKE